MFRSGVSVAAGIDGVADEAVQPNGVDLTVAAVFEQATPGRIGREGKTVGERGEVAPVGEEPPTYRLEPGAYVVRYGERLKVPEDSIGFVLPRSTLLRNSCTLNTAVWDAGYEGRGEGMLHVGHEIEIEQGARIAQFVVADAEHEGTYDGTYQGEN